MKQGWKLQTLESLYEITSSKRVHKSDWKGEGIPFYRAREVVKLARDGYVDNDLFISHELYSEYTNTKGEPKEGDILVSAVGTLGRCYLIKKNEKLYFKDASVLWFRKTSTIESKYVEYAFKSDLILDQVMQGSMGATVGTYTITRAKNTQIPVPPLEEQKQIVAKLDQCFEAIDKAKANATKNLENAKELFQSKLNEIFSQKGEGWVEKRLIDISKFIDYRGRTPKKTTEGVRLITAKNVKMGILNRNPQEFIHTDDYDDWMTRGIPNRNDVLFTTEAPLANVALLDTDERVALAQRIITLSVDQDIISGEYLCYCMQSKYVQDKILAKGTGATVTGIKAKLLKEIGIPVVDHKTQAKFVNNLNKLKEQTQSLESKYQQELNSLEELKKSILQKAFEGEL